MTARVEVDVRECVGVVCGCGVWVWCVGVVCVGVVCGCGCGVWVWCGVGVVCGCGCGVGISMSPYCMLDGVRQGRRDI